jgi:hypothetical protein
MAKTVKDPRNIQVNTYFSPEEVAFLDALATKQGYSRTALLRHIVKETVRTALAQEEAVTL